MSTTTGIEWTDATWNPTRGCTRVSEGCRHCYAERMAARFNKPGQWGHGLATLDPKGEPRWTGRVELDEAKLDLPLRWRAPRRIFVNSTSDLFHESLPDEAIDRVFAVMALAQQHTFQVLTKRPERMARFIASLGENRARVQTERQRIPYAIEEFLDGLGTLRWPLPNVWLGVSVEDGSKVSRARQLAQTPAAIRFLSIEPLLGPIGQIDLDGIHWVIVGGESGPGARPMHPDWARSLRDQCAAASVPFFFKQWGEWAVESPKPGGDLGGDLRADSVRHVCADRQNDGHYRRGDQYMRRLGKRRAGRLLDGRTHDEFPR